MEVEDKCYAIWQFLSRKSKYAYTQQEIRKGLQKDDNLKDPLRKMNAKDILCALGVLKFNSMVKRIEAKDNIYWQGISKWPPKLQKKHGGYY